MRKRPAEIYALFVLHLVLALNALAAGWAMMTGPDGSALRFPENLLSRSPFPNYWLPGLLLFLFNGLFPAFTLYGLVRKPRWHWAGILNIYAKQHWSWTYSIFAGIILIIWIAVQLFFIPYFWLQPACIGLGVLILVFTLMPRVMRYYQQTAGKGP